MPNPLLKQDCLDIHAFLIQPGSSFSTTGLYRYEDIDSAGDLRCDWKIRKSALGLAVHGALNGTLLLNDAESAQAVEHPVNLIFDEQFYLTPAENTRHSGSRTPRHEDDGEAGKPVSGVREQQLDDLMESLAEDSMLDLRDLARQYLVMEITGLPMLPSGSPPA
ncbi:MAG: hypothetical protein AB7P76_07900 [Candidatus Melainabacteria bacterium]